MAPTAPEKASKAIKAHPKLPRLSKDQKISKRPLLHPAISHPLRSPKVVYVSTTTPFHATTSKVLSLLSSIESKSTGPLNFSSSHAVLKTLHTNMTSDTNINKGKNTGRGEEVLLKATGKAIEKLLRIANWFQGLEREGRYRVRIGTGSVGAVDDVIVEGEEIGESRVRRVSCLEVAVRLR